MITNFETVLVLGKMKAEFESFFFFFRFYEAKFPLQTFDAEEKSIFFSIEMN